MAKVPSKKIQFYLHPKDAEDLGRLQEMSRQASVADVIRNALTLYLWAAERVAAGGRLEIVGADGERCGYVLPGLDRIPTADKEATTE
jgi:hypothetical protein